MKEKFELKNISKEDVTEAILTKNDLYYYLVEQGKIIKFECETIDSDINKETREKVKDLLWK